MVVLKLARSEVDQIVRSHLHFLMADQTEPKYFRCHHQTLSRYSGLSQSHHRYQG